MHIKSANNYNDLLVFLTQYRTGNIKTKTSFNKIKKTHYRVVTANLKMIYDLFYQYLIKLQGLK